MTLKADTATLVRFLGRANVRMLWVGRAEYPPRRLRPRPPQPRLCQDDLDRLSLFDLQGRRLAHSPEGLDALSG